MRDTILGVKEGGKPSCKRIKCIYRQSRRCVSVISSET